MSRVMSRAARRAVISLAVSIGLALAVCGSASGSVLADKAAASVPCFSLRPLPALAGEYDACATLSGTYLRLQNTSQYDNVLYLEVPLGEPVPILSVVPPSGSSLTDRVERAEFPATFGGSFAVIPPGATFTALSLNGVPVHLIIGIDKTASVGNIFTMGLVGVIGDKINPADANVEAILACASYVRRLPQSTNAPPNSPAFWDKFLGAYQCSQAFRSVANVLDLGGESAAAADRTIADVAEDDIGDFLGDIWPKLLSVFSETLFH
jgi:hypothetical protein